MDLNKLRGKFGKKYGAASITTANDLAAISHIPYGISCGSLAVDLMLGRPGFPAGRLTEIVGLTHTGKSTLLYGVFRECQRLGGQAILLETEQAYEDSRLTEVGVDTEKLLLMQPKHLEEAFEMIGELMIELRIAQKFTGPIVIGLDTIAGTPTAVELEGGYDDKHMAAAAKAIALGMRKIIRPLAEYKVVLVFLNQLRSSMEKYGDPYVSYGGKAIGSSSSIRIRLATKQSGLVIVGGQPVACKTFAKTIKNKLAIPFQQCEYFLDFATGIDPIEDLWRVGIKLKIIKTAGAGFKITLGEKTAAVTRDTFSKFIVEKFKSPEALRERFTAIAIERKLIKSYGETKHANSTDRRYSSRSGNKEVPGSKRAGRKSATTGRGKGTGEN